MLLLAAAAVVADGKLAFLFLTPGPVRKPCGGSGAAAAAAAARFVP